MDASNKMPAPPVRLLGESAENCETHNEGADNISTVKTNIGMDHQEVIGAENQRLPAYEIQSTKQELQEGLGAAASNIEEGTNTDASHPEDESIYTIGLMRPLSKVAGKPLADVDKGGDINSQPLNNDATQFPSEIGSGNDAPKITLHERTGELYRRNLEDEYIINAGIIPKLGGTFLPNPSKKHIAFTNPHRDDTDEEEEAADETEEATDATQEATDAKDQPLGAKDNISAGLTSNKAANVTKPTPEKHKQTNFPEHAIDKENAMTTVS